jgi:hypothetical protein
MYEFMECNLNKLGKHNLCALKENVLQSRTQLKELASTGTVGTDLGVSNLL